ncbi:MULTISPECIES: dephospho-CoA kinase [Methylosinus]|uniref:Dephospho-CoA kinase n=1 Tax=Methylosinus trichosporium (strain ATCC 35070 / NCIMB 11131 / UNIQEM 75 / OB3b) TaxID=595536 RepID=A0A2D2D0X8_METT3|nr:MULTISPECIES: dephospho-CoA kinase [Methylosinus]ATQ68661.1 dephospho-CoA kinase [Methylosinus trichosporium OB3b]OBS53175.1 dephospho-CoA kinase [Methylosinus sp. 3S-1]
MLTIGLTGSIGMGKSTTADMFRAEGVPVYDSDRAVHEIYSGPDAARIEALFPGILVDGVVDRAALAARVLGDAQALRRLEAIVHPLVLEKRAAFVEERRRADDALVLFDIPLLFETGGDADVDVVVVVTAPEEVQRERVLARPGMTEEKFAAIRAKQTPDAEKRRRADFIVHTDRGVDSAREQVRLILRELKSREPKAR